MHILITIAILLLIWIACFAIYARTLKKHSNVLSEAIRSISEYVSLEGAAESSSLDTQAKGVIALYTPKQIDNFLFIIDEQIEHAGNKKITAKSVIDKESFFLEQERLKQFKNVLMRAARLLASTSDKGKFLQ